MSVVILVELHDGAMLYRAVLTKSEFRTWRDGNETKLYWRGRQVRRIFSMGRSTDCWLSVPLEGRLGAIALLRKRMCCRSVRRRPTPEGELPS